ncbi:hypothetical protein TEQG_04721 [Trichophyton equinum CBS 127.97]|uniref:Uncharacterized protein n=1 Tax=Trichophyton equinum (strain ATCC MYA-4606 / CBS 127.97) TaxID=559882 RepID=F2PUZ5_TRIEC|nr:hypothetical protein TEQG_04721 [Trichophyton equinum CBS 127.97]
MADEDALFNLAPNKNARVVRDQDEEEEEEEEKRRGGRELVKRKKKGEKSDHPSSSQFSLLLLTLPIIYFAACSTYFLSNARSLATLLQKSKPGLPDRQTDRQTDARAELPPGVGGRRRRCSSLPDQPNPSIIIIIIHHPCLREALRVL